MTGGPAMSDVSEDEPPDSAALQRQRDFRICAWVAYLSGAVTLILFPYLIGRNEEGEAFIALLISISIAGGLGMLACMWHLRRITRSPWHDLACVVWFALMWIVISAV
jgi:hypothetical protein